MWEIGWFNRGRRSDRISGRYGVNPGRPSEYFAVFSPHPVGNPFQMLRADKTERATSKTATHQASAVDFGAGNHDLHERIQFGATDLVVVSQAHVRRGDEFAKASDITTSERGVRIVDPLVLGDDVPAATIQPIIEQLLLVFELCEFEIAQCTKFRNLAG